MQLAEWMREKGWTMLGMQRKTGISRPTIKKAIMKESDITLKTAMAIHKFTRGEVTFEEMLRENDKDKQPKKNRKKDHEPLPADIAV